MPFPPPALGGEEHRLRVVRASKDATIGVDIAKGKDSTVVVEKVKPGTAAAEANILPGDLLRTVGGVELASNNTQFFIAHFLPSVSSQPADAGQSSPSRPSPSRPWAAQHPP